jgi:hypothetical protein
MVNPNSFDIYKAILEQNKSLQQSVSNKTDYFNTREQLFNYIGIDWKFLITLNGLLLIIYYVIFAGLAIILFVSSKNKMTIYPKIGLIVMLGILPFIYLWIEIFIWDIIRYIWSLLRGNVYTPGIEGRGK